MAGKNNSEWEAEVKATEKENFKQFLTDLVDYCLKTLNLRWERPEDKGLYDITLFNIIIGDAVLRYRNGYDELFRSVLRSGNPLQDVRLYLYNFTTRHFTRQVPLKLSVRLFVFCAFLVDLAVYVCRNRRPDLVPEAIEEATRVHGRYLVKLREGTYWKHFISTVVLMARYFDPDGLGQEMSLDEKEHEKLVRIFDELSLGLGCPKNEELLVLKDGSND